MEVFGKFILFGSVTRPLVAVVVYSWPANSGGPHTLKPSFAKRQLRKCFFVGHPIYRMLKIRTPCVKKASIHKIYLEYCF